jgi:hypothetical protein
MTSHDSASIEELAAKLNHSAKSIPLVYLGLGLVMGLMIGVALGGDTVGIQRAAGIAYGVIGAFIGWTVGQSRQASLQLQALTAVAKRQGQGQD